MVISLSMPFLTGTHTTVAIDDRSIPKAVEVPENELQQHSGCAPLLITNGGLPTSLSCCQSMPTQRPYTTSANQSIDRSLLPTLIRCWSVLLLTTISLLPRLLLCATCTFHGEPLPWYLPMASPIGLRMWIDPHGQSFRQPSWLIMVDPCIRFSAEPVPSCACCQVEG